MIKSTEKKTLINIFMDISIFLYILSLYLLTYKQGLYLISNALAFNLIIGTLFNFLVMKRKIIINKIVLLQLTFLLISSLSTIHALDQHLAYSKSRTLLLIFFMMFCFINYIKFDTTKLHIVLNFFIYSGVIASIYIVLTSDFTQLTRFGNDLGNVNVIGNIIGISATFSFFKILNKERTFLNIASLFVMIPTIILTGSRKALLFTSICFIVILYLENRKNMMSKIKFVAMLVFVIVILYNLVFNIPIFYEILGSRMENFFSLITGDGTGESSINVRVKLIEEGFYYIKKNPLWGYGIDNFRVLSVWQTYSHNNFIEIWVGTGLLGVLLFYIMNIIVIVDLYKYSKKTNPQDRLFCYTLIAIFLSFIVSSTTTVYYDNKHFSILLAMTTPFIRSKNGVS